jgi:hypothetical protein
LQVWEKTKFFPLTSVDRFSKRARKKYGIGQNQGGGSLMKIMLSTLLVLSVFVLMLPARGNAAEIEPFGMLSASVGYERERLPNAGHGVSSNEQSRGSGLPAGAPGARSTVEALGVYPLGLPNFGVQGSGQLGGGERFRGSASLGPIYAWAGGKSGIFLTYQHRNLHDSNFFWLSPTLALYFDQLNVNFRYTQQLARITKDTGGQDIKVVEAPTNQFQATGSYFPAMDVAFLKKDNLELTFGAQVNTFSGPNSHKIQGAGVGPVVGVSMMPWQNVEVNLFRATLDNRSRYKVDSGVRLFFAKSNNATLKELRRKYMEAGPGPVGAYSAARHD